MEYTKVDLGNTIYVGTKKNLSSFDDINKTYKYNSSYFHELMNNRQYEQAADYLNNYRFKDPNEELKRQQYVNTIKHKGRVMSSIYSKLDDADKDQVEFIDNVYEGNLSNLINRDKPNDYAKNFVNSIKNFGSTSDTEATEIAITFYPKKNKGIFGLDWAAGDLQDEYTIETFYNNTGLNENILNNTEGVQLIKHDGQTIIKFKKDSALTNKIIANIPTHASGYEDTASYLSNDRSRLFSVQSYDKNGNLIKNNKNKNDGINWDHSNLTNELLNIRKQIEEANYIKEQAYAGNDLSEFQTPSVIGRFINPELEALNAAVNSGEITKEEYNSRKKLVDAGMLGIIKSLGSDYLMYSNFGDPNIETLKEMDPTQRTALIQKISAANDSDIHLQSMVSNGTIGTLITIDATNITGKDAKPNPLPGENIDAARTQIFIPGLFSEQAQQSIDNDIETRAAQELNTMAQYNYEIPLNRPNNASHFYLGAGDNGQYVLIEKDKNGNVLEKKNIDTNEATKALCKQFYAEDAINQLMVKHMNIEGDMINPENFQEDAKKMAVVFGYNMNPNSNLTTIDERTGQQRDLSINEIFENYEEPTENYHSKINNRTSVNATDYLAYKDIFDVYDYLMEELNAFNTDRYGNYTEAYLTHINNDFRYN